MDMTVSTGKCIISTLAHLINTLSNFSTCNITDTCLPSPKNKYSPYSCSSKSNMDIQPFPSSLTKKEVW